MNPDKNIIFATLTPAAKNRKQSYIRLFFIFFFVLLLTFDVSHIYSQQPTLEWIRFYDGPDHLNNDAPSKAAVAPNGDIVVTGVVFTNNEGYDIATVKYSSSGNQIWSTIYNSPANLSDYVNNQIVFNNSGELYLPGNSGNNFGPFNWSVLKYNSNGVLQWVSNYGGGNTSDVCTCIKSDSSENLYIAGIRRASNNAFITIAKYLSNGDSVWVRNYPLTNVDVSSAEGSFFQITGNQIYIGATYAPLIPTGTPQKFLTLKYDTSGVLIWGKTYSNSQIAYFGPWVLKDNLGFIYRYGYTSGNFNGIILIKYNYLGDTVWVRTYNSPFINSSDVPEAGIIDSSNNIYLSGHTLSTNGYDLITLKYNPNGDIIWQARYNSGGNFTNLGAKDLTMDNSGNLYVLGTLIQNSVDKIGTFKYDSSGNLKWLATYNGVGVSIALDSANNIYSVGTRDSSSGTDWITIKYSQLLGIKQISNQIPNKINLYQNYPNPFNPVTKIKFAVPKKSFVLLRVFDILGRQKELLVNQELQPAEYEVSFDGTNYASGIYYYTLQTENFRETKKLILLK